MKKLSKRHKLYVAILGVALFALVFDQVLFSPGSAGASETAAFHPSASPAARAKATANRIPELLASVPKPETTLASRLDDLAQKESLSVDGIGDALRAPAAWLPNETVVPDVPVDDPEGSKIAERFRLSHQLHAVMANTQGGYAIVDGRSLRVGQELDGFTLADVRARSITFERGGVTVELSLPDGK